MRLFLFLAGQLFRRDFDRAIGMLVLRPVFHILDQVRAAIVGVGDEAGLGDAFDGVAHGASYPCHIAGSHGGRL